MTYNLPNAESFKNDPLQYLKLFMTANDIPVLEMGKLLGMHRSAMSIVLAGKRRLSLSSIRSAVFKLGLDPRVMLTEFECERKRKKMRKADIEHKK